RWRAELLLGSDRVPVVGLPAARIPSVTLVEGRHATIVGIVRRPYPSAADRRFAIEPRGRADLAIGPPDPGLPGGAGTGPGSTTTGPGNVLGDGAAGLPLDIDIGQLGEHVGQT